MDNVKLQMTKIDRPRRVNLYIVFLTMKTLKKKVIYRTNAVTQHVLKLSFSSIH